MKKIAIVRRNGLGDLLATYPLINFLKNEDPSHFITLFVGEMNYPIMPFLPAVDEIVVVPSKGNKYLQLLSAVWKKRKRNYDIALSAKSSPMKLMNIALYLTGAKERRAYVGEAWHSRLINKPLPYDAQKAKRMHQALKCLHLVAPHLLTVPQEFYPKIQLPPSLYKPYLSHFDSQEPTIFISATTSRNENCFDSVPYARILNHLAVKYPFRVCLVSMEKNALRAQLIAGHLRMKHRLYFTRSFEEFLSLLKLSDMAFLGDGGNAHIAAAMDKPQVVLFGQTHPTNWHPLSPYTEALYHPLHVNSLSDQKIYEALEGILCKILSSPVR